MHVGKALGIGLACAALLLSHAGAAHAAAFKAVLLVPQDDPRLERARLERGYLGQVSGAAIDGITMALADAEGELEAAGASIKVDVVPVASPQAAADATRKAEQAGAVAVLTDLDAPSLLAAADAAKGLVINLSETSDALRQDQCRARMLHVAPSERMRADAIAQTLLTRKWSNVLLLVGSGARDVERGAVAAAAIKRFGLKLGAQRPYELTADPRKRELANPLLLTKGDHDVVWVVDSDGEFARSLPYRTATPRPVVGDAGLFALAWHARYDRYGATQVSRRFARSASRAMGAVDWQAYVAGKALVAGALGAPKGPVATFQKALVEAELDASKGVTMGFRSWDGQLRQTLLLTDGQGVIAIAPVEGVLHPKNNLDTLGADAPEKLCKVRAG
jgi:ABC transporter substrate binding protein (PQQ-dependent alcohol dehydrogenase system)